ncbi:MAG: 50S ribosomal protein L16 [archaeon]|nr:50S ribosomal protein L16 [Candidatus Micrarchaeota archaeon]
MGLRPGRCYRSRKKRAFSRVAVTVHKKNYIGSTPFVRTRQFNMGNPIKEFTHILDLVVDEDVQLRDNSIEAIRVAINREIVKIAGKDGFFMKVRIYPYQILRENKQAQGAGADRVTKGMSHPYGKPIGRAARVRKGQKIVSILVDEEHIEAAKKALMKAKPKLTSKVHVNIGTDVKLIGTKPRKIKVVEAEKKEEAEEETKEEEKKVEGKEGEEKKESKTDKKAELKKELQKEKLKEKLSGEK